MISWLLEISALIGSILSTVAIGILLAHYEGTPVFDWNGVTLNAVVSVFSALSKALLAFTLAECLGQARWIWFSWKARPLNDVNALDEASRGPLGSLKILGQPIGRSFISIGAIAIIVSAAIDPFVQLTIGKRDALQFKPDAGAQIGFAKRYSKGAYSAISATSIQADDGNSYRDTNIDADFSMKSAIFYGLSESDSSISQHMKYSCYSGNCTWDVYDSLAVCSTCTDLQDQLTSESKMDTPLSVYLATTNPGTMIGNFVEYKLPNGLTGDNSVSLTAYGTGNASQTVTFRVKDTLIWAMSMINLTSTADSDAKPKVSAVECGLWYCVNKYRSSVEKGNLTETVTAEDSKRNPDSWQRIPDQSSDKIKNEPSNSINYGLSASVGRTDLQIGNGFNLTKAAIFGISDFMNKTFSSPVRAGHINAYVLGNTTFIPTVMQELYSSPDIAATFRSLAKSMTNNIRQNGDNGTTQHGETGTYQILIRTRPWFLALPIALNVAALVFLALVILFSRKSQLAVWGTNALPILAVGSKTGRIFDENAMSARAMERVAKREHFRFPGLDNHGAVSTGYREEQHEMMAQAPNRKRQPTASVISAISADGRDVHDHNRFSSSISP